MWDSKLFKAGIAVLLLFLIILVGSRITFIFRPLIIAIEVFFYSFLISGALYYLMIPLVDWLARRRLPRSLAVIITFIIFLAVLTGVVALVGPSLQKEFTALIISMPERVDELIAFVEGLTTIPLFRQLFALEALSIERLSEFIPNAINQAVNYALNSIALIINYTTSVLITILVVPFLLYYLLVESGRNTVSNVVNKLAPRLHAERTNRSLAEINSQLGNYVQGLGIVSILVGVLAYIGLLIIGIDYALVLSVFVALTNLVPIIGAFIGAAPAVLVAALNSPLMVLKTIIVMIIVQQLDSYVVRPFILGRKMAINPLVIIMVVLIAGRLGGIVGILLAMPLFTVIKIVVSQLYETVRDARAPTADPE